MAEPSQLPPTRVPVLRRPLDRFRSLLQGLSAPLPLKRIGQVMAVGWGVAAAIVTISQPIFVQRLERQTQVVFFALRGKVNPPSEVVILKIDEYSLSQAQNARNGSAIGGGKSLRWPLERALYARVIDRLMQAGAATVTVDILFTDPSGYGPKDDEVLRQTLQRHAGRVTVGAMYSDGDIRQGGFTQLLMPLPELGDGDLSIGTINFWREVNGKIHQLGSQYPVMLARQYSELAEILQGWTGEVPSLAEATLQALKRSKPQFKAPSTRGNGIFFYGPQGTFDQVPLWDVIDPANWGTYLENGNYFQNKIVLIGSTADSLGDIHDTPFSQMAGVEIHANAIATLLEGRALGEALPNSASRGWVIFLSLTVLAILYTQPRRGLSRFTWAMVLAGGWMMVGYITFTQASLILPVAIPVLAIVLGGISHLTIGAIHENYKKLKLRRTLRSYAAAPIVQEIISQQDDFLDLLPAQQEEMLGKKLGRRYQVTQTLSAGGFGETYIAEDTQRPGNPKCVVKRLRPVSDNPKVIRLARRLFHKEAETLERLGRHEQIPQLLAYFEEDQEFYLIQEFVDGHPLSRELPPGRQLPEAIVVSMLGELLQVLDFVHSQGVIHRDIKPSNIVRRRSDGQLVLIDFGAVKELHTQLADSAEPTGLTVSIGTRGYMPPEQCAGSPRVNSDLYALGMTAIQSLSGLPPSRFQEDARTGEILWQEQVHASQGLVAVLSRMVRYDFTQRYQSAAEVLQALEKLTDITPLSMNLADLSLTSIPIVDTATSTAPWPETFGASSVAPTSIPPTTEGS